MANYECVTRSNYFRVKDPEAFKEFMSRVYGGDAIDLWENKQEDDTLLFGFGVFGDICGYCAADGDDEDGDYEAFCAELQKYVAEDDAIIILESGNEKLRYVTGSAVIITSTEIEYLDITTLAKMRAAALLKNPQWVTQCDY